MNVGWYSLNSLNTLLPLSIVAITHTPYFLGQLLHCTSKVSSFITLTGNIIKRTLIGQLIFELTILGIIKKVRYILFVDIFLLIIECFITLLNPYRNMKGFINLFRSNQPIIFYQFAVVNKYTCHFN